MKQTIKTPFFEKVYYGMILTFCFCFPIFLIRQTDLSNGFENLPKQKIIIPLMLFSLGLYSIFKIYENAKSIFIFSDLTIEKKEILIDKIGNGKYFKVLKKNKSQIITLSYQKYVLGLDYEVNIYFNNNYFEFNTFGNRFGIFDFGTRKRIIKIIKKEIEAGCASL